MALKAWLGLGLVVSGVGGEEKMEIIPFSGVWHYFFLPCLRHICFVFDEGFDFSCHLLVLLVVFVCFLFFF